MMLLEPQPSPGRGRITSCVLTRPTLRNEWRSGGSHYDISQSHFSAVNILHTPTGPPTHTTVCRLSGLHESLAGQLIKPF